MCYLRHGYNGLQQSREYLLGAKISKVKLNQSIKRVKKAIYLASCNSLKEGTSIAEMKKN